MHVRVCVRVDVCLQFTRRSIQVLVCVCGGVRMKERGCVCAGVCVDVCVEGCVYVKR